MSSRQDDVAQFEEVILQRLRVAATGALTPYAVASAKPGVMYEHTADRLIAQLQTEVLASHRDGKSYEIVEPWVYASWTDQLLHSLPADSFRYRFVRNLLGRDPEMRRTRHEIDVKVSDTFPESTMRLEPQFGHAHVAIQYHDYSRYEVPSDE